MNGTHKRVTALDVAALAKVSRSAVSRTFTPGAHVAPAMRARVIEAAEALGYRPNLLARGLITQRSSLIAVVLANLNSPFFSEFVARLNMGLRLKGYRTLLLVVGHEHEADEALQEALDYTIDGAILISATPSPQLIAHYDRAHVPMVVLDRREAGPSAALVWTDGLSVGMQVAELMLRDGRRRPAALIGAGRPHTREFQTFADCMERAGAAPCRWIEAGLDYEPALDTIDRLLADRDSRPDAIFAATDGMAIAALDAARFRHGLAVPGDLSIVGTGDTLPSRWLSQQLSTVQLPIAALVTTAIATMVARIESPEEPAPRIWLDCDIVERGTTGPAPAARPEPMET